MTAARLLFLAAAIAGASLLAGCGGGHPEDFEEPTAPTVRVPSSGLAGGCAVSADTFTHTFHTMAEWMRKDAAQRDQKPKPARVPTAQPLAAASIPGALLRVDTVCSVVGLSRATIYRLMDAGTFPRPLHITPRCTRWRADDVAAWSAAQGVAA